LSFDDPDVIRKLGNATEALNGLRDIFAEEEPLSAALDRTAAGAVQAIPDVDAVTITVLTGDVPTTEAITDKQYLDLDIQQYLSGRGPCLEAARTHRPVRASTRDSQRPWPEFVEAAARAGVQAYLSLPLLLDSDPAAELVGSLNLYSGNTDAFDPFDEALIRLFSVAAAQSISNARRWQLSRIQTRNLEHALISRAEIDQAKGILMAIHRCTPSEAFDLMVEQSQRRNIKLRQIAREFLSATTQPD
jgi:GAF domain-containing protein